MAAELFGVSCEQPTIPKENDANTAIPKLFTLTSLVDFCCKAGASLNSVKITLGTGELSKVLTVRLQKTAIATFP
jgi:hypothetical protein